MPSVETITQRRTSVADAGVTKPVGAANSAFEAGQLAKPKRTYVQGSPLDPEKTEIKKGVPLPPLSRGGVPGRNAALMLLNRMKAGDMVEVRHAQANSMAAQAKKSNIKIAKRKLSDTHSGVWKL